jgi:hypothetical protein
MVLKKIHIFFLTAVLLSVFTTGCTTTKSSKAYEHTTFLSDYSRLKPVKDGDAKEYIDPSVDFKKYNKVLLDRIMVWYKEDAEHKGIDPTQLKILTDYYYEAILRELGEAYPVVNKPGPDVMRVRIAITELVPSRPEMSVVMLVVPYATVADLASGAATQEGDIGGAVYLGETAVEVDVLDSETNSQIAAYIEKRLPKKYNVDASEGTTEAVKTYSKSYFDAYTEWNYAKAAFDYWAELMRKRLDELRSVRAGEK